MTVEFTAHNIRLDDGTLTKPEAEGSMDTYPWFVAARRILNVVFTGKKDRFRIADVGCFEGGYAVEFARMGFQVVGIEVRDSNIEACNFVKSKVDLPNLNFVKDNAWNIAKYGEFDAVFCCGLLYHLDKPRQYLEVLSQVTKRLLILQTHFATNAKDRRLSLYMRRRWKKITKNISMLTSDNENETYKLSSICRNEGIQGRWFTEYKNSKKFSNRESVKLASWDNRCSFWIQREHLLQAIKDVGFDIVMEQFDSLSPNIAESMLYGYYKTRSRGTFIGIKTE